MTELVKRLGRPWTRRQIAGVVLFLLLAALLAVLFFSLRTERRLVPVEGARLPGGEAAAVPERLVTAEQLGRMAYTDSALGDLAWELSEASVEDLNRVLEVYNIRTPEAISQFLAQAAVETAAGRFLTEEGDEAYFERYGYTVGTRGAGFFQLTFGYGQMAFSTWMMKKYVPELAGIEYRNPTCHTEEQIAQGYYAALQQAANLGLDVSQYSRIVFDPQSPVETGADYIARAFAWESAGYYWHITGIGDALGDQPGVENTDIVSRLVGGSHWQSRREAYLAFYPVMANQT